MDFKKAGAISILVTMMSSPLVVWAAKQLMKVSVHEEKIKSIESDVKDMHWYLIKRNDVKVPKNK